MRLIRAIQDSIHRWYSADRIRLSPSRGSLVRLQVGDRVLIRETLFIVVDRESTLCDSVSQVVYRLREPDSSSRVEGRIFVELAGSELEFISAKLEFLGEMIELFEDDPVILQPVPTLPHA